jgi:hypothetical protein
MGERQSLRESLSARFWTRWSLLILRHDMLKNNELQLIIKAGLNQRNSNQNSHVIRKRTPDMPKGTEMEMTGFA